MGVSTRTVRRFIKAGKINAELVAGKFGEEYRIPEIPTNLGDPREMEAETVQRSVNTTVQTTVQTSTDELKDMFRDLQEKNLALAAQLGATTERMRSLESQVKLLSVPKRLPWWKRLFGRKS